MTDTKIDTNKLIGGMGAVSLVLGGIVWQNLNSSISNIAVELKETATELKEITTDLKRDLQETNRTIGQMKEDLAVVRTKLEYVSPRPQKMDWAPPSVGTSSETTRPDNTGTSSGSDDKK